MTDTNQIAHEINLNLFKQGKHQVPDTPLQQTTLFNWRNNALITDVTADKTDREVLWPTAVDYVTMSLNGFSILTVHLICSPVVKIVHAYINY